MANTYTTLLKLRLPALGDIGWDDEVNDNTQMLEILLAAFLPGNRVINGCAPTDGGGLVVNFALGKVDVAGAEKSISANNLTCAANIVNWLYVNSAGTMVLSTTAPTGDYVAIAMIDTTVDDILRIADLRWVIAKPQNVVDTTLSGTPKVFTIYDGATPYYFKAYPAKA